MAKSPHSAKYLLREKTSLGFKMRITIVHQNRELLEMPSILIKFEEFYYFRTFCFSEIVCYDSYFVV